MMNASRWIKLFLLSSFSIILFISFVNYIINPYNVFNHGLDSKFQNKSDLLSDRMSKFYIANQHKPDTIIMGTSRSGLFSEKQLLPYLEGEVYNYSLAGSSVDEQARYIEYMITHRSIKTLIWSLDFFSFNPDKPMNPSFESERLADTYYMNDYFISLFSFKTLYRSTKTILKNFSSTGEKDISGQLYTEQEIDFNIHYTLQQYATEKSFLASKSFQNPQSISAKLELIRTVVTLCKKHNVRCFLYTSPVYYRHIDMIYAIGLGKTFEAWKTGIAEISPFIDFCTFNTITTDKMNFNDSSHVIGNIGKIVFARIFEDKNVTIPDDFGYLATPENIQYHIDRDRKMRTSFSLD